ncbi:MAG: ATP-dependent helicase HepA [Pelotomaculum sp. PtaB.Bin104]|nr:MAG: ATP-dependent helicase HepA [Pelotomaculum sp. PtaB.Bin104]
MTVQTIKITCEWLAGEGFLIWGDHQDKHYDQTLSLAQELKFCLLIRHRPSFYGTFIDVCRHDGRFVIKLPSRAALDFFTETTWAENLPWQWSAEILKLRKIAPKVRETLAAGLWRPDFDRWLAGQRGWLIDWPDQRTFTEDRSDIPYLEEWAGLVINELIEQNQEIGRSWKTITKAYPLLQTGLDSQFPFTGNEEEWLEAIGWNLNKTPFKTCLELAEPDAERNCWRLNIILQDKNHPDRFVYWEPAGSAAAEKIQEEWQEHQEQIRRDLTRWTRILPELASLPKADKISPPVPSSEPGSRNAGEEQHEGPEILRRELSETEAWEFLNTGSLQLAQAGYTVLLPKWWEEVQQLKPLLKVKTRSSVGSWGESCVGVNQIIQFNWSLAVGDLELTEEEFRQFTEKERRLMQVRGKWIQLDPSLLRKIQRFVRKKKGLPLGEILHLHLLADAPAAQEEQAPGAEEALQIELELSGQLAQMVEQLNRLSAVPIVDTAAAFHGQLRNYQRIGASWLFFLRRFGLGSCLADDMGLGKTIQWIAYLLKVKESEEQLRPSLLICPTTVLGNWTKELERFAPGLKVYLHYGPRRARGEDFPTKVEGMDLVITSYNLAHLDEAELCSIQWDCICLDEAQNIKNEYTKQSAAVRKFTGRHRVAMTGTPMENRLTELWSIFDFINPGYLGGSGEFSRRFVSVIERKKDRQVIERVQRLIQPFLLRRLKSDPAIELDLPAKQELKDYIPLTLEQASLYENVIHELFEQLKDVDGMARRGLILSAITRLKQICDHPALLLKEETPSGLRKRSNKIDRLLEMVDELRQEGDRCLIFTQFVKMGNLLQQALERELGEQAFFLHGGTPRKQREEMISRFQAPPKSGQKNCNVFILSLKAGGLGLNLTAANHVFHFDRWWNPAVENQATDRSHRIGQAKNVLVHKFISLGTMEERIDEMIERKTGLNELIVGGGETWITEIPTSELRDIFALRKEWIGS